MSEVELSTVYSEIIGWDHGGVQCAGSKTWFYLMLLRHQQNGHNTRNKAGNGTNIAHISSDDF